MKQNILHITKRLLNTKTLFVVAFLISFLSQAQVSSSIDSTKIKIGEEIQYSIVVEADTTDLVVFPEGQTFLPLEVIESYKVDTTFENAKYRLLKKYGVTQFDSGKYTIPSQRIIINEKAYQTDSIKVEVADVVVDTTKQKMFTIKPAIEVKKPSFDFIKALYWIVPILLLIAGIVYFFFRRKKKKEEREKILPPYEEALVALQKLDNSHLLKEDKSKEYYSSLTEIIKRYLDREVDDKALESTSNELIERLELHRDSGNFDFDSETISKLEKIFKRADLIKFAKMKEQEGQASVDRSTIEEILNETKEIIPELTEEELLENEQYLELLKKKQKRQKIKKTISVGVTVAITVLVVNILTQGWDTVRDNFLGNDTKDLLEGRWYKSEYGNPAVIIETPKILTRKTLPVPEEVNEVVESTEYFEYGDITKRFYISLVTATYNSEIMEGQELDLNLALESSIKGIENDGGVNIVTKQEEFSTEQGINGLKAFGDFNLKNKNGKISNFKVSYEILIFKQNNGLQMVSVIYNLENEFASKIKDRIINSVELVISEK